MATVLSFGRTADGRRVVHVEGLLDRHGPYKVGRWCSRPHVPDRCDFCPLADIRPAVGFVEDPEGWRQGYCRSHKRQAYRSARREAEERARTVSRAEAEAFLDGMDRELAALERGGGPDG